MRIAGKDSHTKIRDGLLCIVAFSIPFPYICASVCILAFCAFYLFTGGWRQAIANFKERKILLLWVAFYALHTISYFYSTDKAQASFDLESKLSFVVLPITIGAAATVSKKALEQIFCAFIYGLLVVAIFCITQAYLEYKSTGQIMVFFYHDLVRGLDANAVYVAWYSIFGSILLLFYPWQFTWLTKKSILYYILCSVLLIFFIMLSARTLIVLFVVLIVPIFLYLLFIDKRTSALKKGITSALVLAVILILLLVPNPVTKRYKDLATKPHTSSFKTDYHNSDQEFSNLTLRLFLWRVGYENIKEHHLWITGAGVGDVSLLQNKKMSELGIKNIYNQESRSHLFNVNLHNMFIQTAVMLGLLGLTILTSAMLLPFTLLKRNTENISFFLFQMVAIFFMMQESALQTQAGIVFFLFFTSLLLNHIYSKNKDVDIVNQL